MEIKGSTTYAAATTQLAATDKTTELAKPPAAQSLSAVDSVTISKEAKALLDAESNQQTTEVDASKPTVQTANSTGGEPEVPPGWPPTQPN